jgi:DNA-binding MarR family transcriptional regulator
LPYSDFTILNTLRRYGDQGGLPVVKLGRLVMRPTGSMTLILDRLEKAGLIERRSIPHDRRSVLIALTEAGSEVSQKSAQAYNAIQDTTLAGVETAEVEKIDHAIRRLLEIMEPRS